MNYRADNNHTVEEIYRKTGLTFDFSERTIKEMGEFVERIIIELNR